MKKSWVVGSIVTGHLVAVALLMMGGCQTVQRNNRTVFGERGTRTQRVQPTEGEASLPGTPTVVAPITQGSPEGRVVRQASEVGKPGTFTEFVVPAGAQAPAVAEAVVRPPADPAVKLPVATVKPVAPPALPQVGSTYKVAQGDTLSHIAQRHGVKTSDILKLNVINNPNAIKVGQELKIPAGGKPAQGAQSGAKVTAPADGTTYKVQPGDSVSVIAYNHKVKTADVLKANNLTEKSIIRVGQTLVIPGAKGAAVAAQPAVIGVKPQQEVKPVTGTQKPIPQGTTPPKPQPQVTEPVREAANVAPSAGGDEYQTYTVKDNEDVYSVAIKWGIHPTVLRQINNLTGSELTPGQVLRVPAQ
jgi:LysM repeat protein